MIFSSVVLNSACLLTITSLATRKALRIGALRCAVCERNAIKPSPQPHFGSFGCFCVVLLGMEWNGRLFFCQHWGGTCQQRYEYNQLRIQPNRLNIENVGLNFWPFLLRWFIWLKTVWYLCMCFFFKLFLVMIMRINWKWQENKPKRRMFSWVRLRQSKIKWN